jgi:quercetin dioxygenase-like cupin family protein
MDIVNAIAKARFSAVRPQHVHLHKDDNITVELLCLEAGQSATITKNRAYYVITGLAELITDSGPCELPTGQLVVGEAGDKCNISNTSEARLLVLVAGS